MRRSKYIMKPKWLKAKIPSGPEYHSLKRLFADLRLHTVCEEAKCPNIGDCWQRKTASIMIMGDTYTRSCGFCAVKTGKPLALDPEEPRNVAIALSQLDLKHLVITSVDRDDLADGGSQHFAQTIREVRSRCPGTTIEVLIPDFKGDKKFLSNIFEAQPDIVNHNLETVRRLQSKVRPQADYDRSLQVLRLASEAGFENKSGIMVGLGENKEELFEAFQDLKRISNISILTLGQYLQPHDRLLKVERYYTPLEFTELKEEAEKIGIQEVASSPFVRSSYHADLSAEKVLNAS